MEDSEELRREKHFWYIAVAEDLHKKGLLNDEGKRLMKSWAYAVWQ